MGVTEIHYDDGVGGTVSIRRRGLDVLASRGGTRFGFFGHSAGGFQGAILSAEEPRLDAIVIAAFESGFALRVANAFERLTPSRDAYVEAVERFEPKHFLGKPGARRLLLQYGRFDTNVPREAALDAFALAAEPKTWREYECGHGDPGDPGDPQALADRFAFFQQELALR